VHQPPQLNHRTIVLSLLLLLLAMALSACGDADETVVPGQHQAGQESASGAFTPAATTDPTSSLASGVTSPASDLDLASPEPHTASPVVDLAGCGRGADREPIPHPTGPGDVLLRVSRTFPSPPMSRFWHDRVPEFTLYGDGTLITSSTLYPAEMPIVTRLSEAGLQALLHDAITAGLSERDAEYTWSRFMRATTTTFTFNAAETRTTVYAVSLESTDYPADLPDPERESRARLRPFLDCLLGIHDWLTADEIAEPAQPYIFGRLQLGIELGGPPNPAVTPNADGQIVEPGIREWPLAIPASDIGIAYSSEGSSPVTRCAVLDGEDLAAFLPAFDDRTRETRWFSDGDYYWLWPRPLLPDEPGCANPR
jgi:hypothetical protein